MRAHLVRALRALADRLAGQGEDNALKLDVRRLEQDVAHWKRRAEGEASSCEWYIAERDRLEDQLSAMRGEPPFRSGRPAEARQIRSETSAPRDAAVSPRPSRPVVVRPVFGRRRPDAPTFPGSAA